MDPITITEPHSTESTTTIEPQPDFPLHILPTPFRDYIETSSIATNDLALLLASTHGITILRDELIGLVRMFNRHGGDDRQRYLSLWSSEPISAIRRDQPDLWIPAPVVSIVGGLQPSLLPRLRSRDEDGLLERFLPIYSLNQQPYWNETATTAPDTESISRCFRTLTRIPNDSIVQRSPEATGVWTTWFNHNVDRTAKTPETGRGFYNKLPAHINRLALILHSLAYPDNPTTPIAGETMTSAIELGEFVRSHIHRTLHRLSQEKPAAVVKLPLDQAILRALHENMYDDGWLSRNQLRIAVGRPTAENFSPALESLLSRRRIEFRIGETNSPGRPTILYRLFEM